MEKGTIISHYKIIEKLGEGGMGVVYKAQDTKLDRIVALKFLSPHLTSDTKTKNRFVQEARTASSLDHPNISVIHEIGETEDGRLFICMSYYDGETLKERIKRDSPDIETTADIALQIARGLKRAHEAGIVHRDIKPGNIIFTSHGEVKIVDFGLAKLMSETGITETGKSVGTLTYMSPEQLQGKKVDYRSDLYSLGVVLYELLTGRRPHGEELYAALMYSIVNVDPPPPSLINPAVPKKLDEIILKLIQKNPDQRFRSASEVVDQLNNYLTERNEPGEKSTNGFTGFVTQPKAIMSVILVFLIIAFLYYPDTRNSLFIDHSTSPDDIHLVVLPFINVGDDPANKPFNDGLMERLTSSLTMLQPQNISYWVVSAGDVRQRNVTSATDALREFNATVAVSGSLQRLSDVIHLTLNLVDTETATQFKSDLISLPVDSLNHLLDEAITKLAQMLEIDENLGSRASLNTSGTTDARSYELYLEGRGYLLDFQIVENISRAIDLFKKAIELDEDYALAYAGLGEAYWRMYDETRDSEWVDLAVEYSLLAKGKDSSLPAVHVTLGMIQFGTGRYHEAVNSYRRAIQLDPVNADAHGGLALAFVQLGNFEGAEETYKRGIRLRPDYWAGYNQLGGFYLGQGKYKEAVPQYEKVIELIPNSSLGYNNLGITYHFLNEYQKAVDLFSQAETIEPRYDVYANLGTLYYYHLAEYKKAAEMYENALSFSDHDYLVWGNLASASYWSGDDSSSVNELYRRALSMAEAEKSVNPHDAQLLVSIAGYHAALDNYSDARINLEKALELAPDNIFVTGSAGTIFEQLGDRDKALSLITNALERGFSLSEIEKDPHLSDFRNDSSFIRFIDKFNSNSEEK